MKTLAAAELVLSGTAPPGASITMKRLMLDALFTLSAALALFVLSGALQPVAGQSLGGAYTGMIGGSAATLTLDRDGEVLTGWIDADGYRYRVDGVISDGTIGGLLVDHQNGASMPFEIVERAGYLTLAIVSPDPAGQLQRVEFRFDRRDGDESPPRTRGAGEPSTETDHPIDEQDPEDERQAPGDGLEDLERDPALIGAWSYSDTYISGEFSATTRLFMQVHGDGSYAYGSGSVSAGLGNDLGSIHGQSGGGDVTRGEWRSKDGVVYIKEEGSPQWMAYARYYVEGGSLLLTFGNGDRQLWRRM